MLIEMPFLLPGKIFRSPMPFSRFDNQDVWTSFLEEEIGLVVILTEQQEYLVYSGKDLPDFYRSNGMEVLHIPVLDFSVPDDLEKWQEGLKAAISAAKNGNNVVVHCLAGIGRTGTFLACLAKDHLDLDSWEAIHWVRDSIPGAMESRQQEEFVVNYLSDDS